MHILMYAQTLRYQIADGCDCLLVVRNKFLVGLLNVNIGKRKYLNITLFISILQAIKVYLDF